MKKRICAFPLVLLLALLVGCGTGGNKTAGGTENTSAQPQSSAQSAPPAEETAESQPDADGAYPVVVDNFTSPEGAASWSAKETTYEAAPERIVVTTRTAAEFLLHLGLGDKIVGVGGNFGTPDASVSAEYDKLPIIGDSYIGKEVALSVNPDFIFGRGGLFDNADWGVGTVDALNDMGVHTYVMASSLPDATFDTIYLDIENIGKIFGVQTQADAFIRELKGRQQAIFDQLEKIDDVKTFAYIHSNDPENFSIYSASAEAFFNDMFSRMKMENVFQNVQGEVSIEALIEADPDILITLGWSDDESVDPVQAAKNNLTNNPKLASLKAIQNGDIYVMDYNHLFSYCYQSMDGMEKLVKEVYPDLFA